MTLSESRKEKLQNAHELAPSTWVKGMVNEAGLPLEFSSHRFLIDIYNDLSPLQVILKAPQVGATTMHVLKALYIASHYDKQIIYTLPTATDMYEMVSGSFNRIISQNQVLMDCVKEGDTMEHKAVGNGLIRFRGTFSAKQAMMVPSDINIHDEVDVSDRAIITQYETRLQAKADGQRWYFSHPSLAGFGVDVYWQQSDKKEWYITCNECKHEQYLTWPENVSREKGQFVCKGCGAEIADACRRNGIWKPTSAGIFSGYHISQLMCPWITANKIIEAHEDPQKTAQYFYNYVLGLPYADSNDAISIEQVLKNVSPDFNNQQDRVLIGVDTGTPCYYTMMNRDGIFHFGKTEQANAQYDPYKHLESFLLKWPRSIMVFDGQGDLTGPRILQAKYPGRVYLCFYRKDHKTQEMIRWGENLELGTVNVDRNRLITLTLDQLKMGDRMKLNGTREEWKPWAEHFANMIRKIEETPYGPEYQWEKRSGLPDHWAHSCFYMLVGWDRFAGMPDMVNQDPWLGALKEGMGDTMTWNDLRKMRS